MPGGGFYLMHRGWMDHPALKGSRAEPFTRREAWCWLIEQAAYEAATVRVGAAVVDLRRGQLSHSFRYLAQAWAWPLGRVQRFVSMLTRCSMIDTESDTGQIVITICNYDKFQAPTAEPIQPSIRHRYAIDTNKKELNESVPPLTPPREGGNSKSRRVRESRVNGHDSDDAAQWRARLRGWQPGGFWHEALWGPPPDQPGCQAPRHLLAEEVPAARPPPAEEAPGPVNGAAPPQRKPRRSPTPQGELLMSVTGSGGAPLVDHRDAADGATFSGYLDGLRGNRGAA